MIATRKMTKTTTFAAAVFVATLIVYIATLPPDILPGDSGELVAASYTLSIGHPPGFPLFLMLGKIFSSAVAVGSVAYRYNLLSAVMASATAAITLLILVRVGVGLLLGSLVAFGLATLGSYWLQATTGDVYTLNGLFTALLLYIALAGKRHGARALLVLAFVGGLAISHHLTLVYALASALLILMLRTEARPQPKTVALSVFLFLLGLSVWLYIPIRSNQAPPLSWGDTSSLHGFLNHVTAQTYRWRLRTFDVGHRLADLARYFKVLSHASGLPLALLACLGIFLNLRRPRLIGGFLLLIGFYAAHYVVYNIPDIDSHIFPALIAVATLAALGLQRVAALRGIPGRATATGLAAVVIIVNFVYLHPRQDAWFASDYARGAQQSAAEACGDGAILICTGDVSFPLLYETYAGSAAGGPSGGRGSSAGGSGTAGAGAASTGVRCFFVGMSNPGSFGIQERPASLDGWVAALAGKYGTSKLALFGAAPPFVLGKPTRICGLVSVIGEPEGKCASPLDFTVRGAGKDLRDYASRLLGGDYYLLLARWCIQEKDAAGTAKYLADALAAGRGDVTTYIEVARIYRTIGMMADARRVLADALKIDPDFFETHDLLAGLALDQDKPDEAITEYSKALRGNPNPAPIYSNLGGAYVAKGDFRQAYAAYSKAIAMDSTLVNAYVGVGRTLEGQGRTEDALAWYERAVRRDPMNEPASHAEASLLLKVGRPADAERLLRKTLEHGVRGSLLLSDLGLAFLRVGIPDSAITYLKEALAADPSMLQARGNLAVAYESKGMTAEAIGQYQALVKSAPPGQMRDRAAQAIKELESAK